MEAFIEAVTPDTREQLNEILTALRNDREKGWEMLEDGTYVRDPDGGETSSQEALYRYFSTRKVSLREPEPPAPAEPPAPPELPGPAESPKPEAESVPEKREPVRRTSFRDLFHRLFKSEKED